MAWRKWIVRGIVWGIVAASVAGGIAYQRWTNPGGSHKQYRLGAGTGVSRRGDQASIRPAAHSAASD